MMKQKIRFLAYSYIPWRISECQSGYKGAYSAPISPVSLTKVFPWAGLVLACTSHDQGVTSKKKTALTSKG